MLCLNLLMTELQFTLENLYTVSDEKTTPKPYTILTLYINRSGGIILRRIFYSKTTWRILQANTVRVEYAERGICHTEGGWPKDINLDDPEQVVRFRKKAEKDESYLQSVMQMSNVSWWKTIGRTGLGNNWKYFDCNGN